MGMLGRRSKTCWTSSQRQADAAEGRGSRHDRGVLHQSQIRQPGSRGKLAAALAERLQAALKQLRNDPRRA